MRPLRVLVVDDDFDARAIIGELLSRWGHEAILAGSAEVGLPLALAAPMPHLILLDYRLPGMTSAAFVRELRREGRHQIPVVVISAADDISLRDVVGTIRKPIEVEHLERVVNAFVPHARRHLKSV
jgi:CheY-like chemotaxis protein